MSVTYDEKKRAHAQLLGFAPKISTLGNKTPSPDFPYSLWIFKMTFLNHEKLFDRQRKFHSGPRTAFLGGRKRKHSERALEQQARPGKEHHPRDQETSLAPQTLGCPKVCLIRVFFLADSERVLPLNTKPKSLLHYSFSRPYVLCKP